MPKDEAVEFINKQDSIEVNRNAKGEYAWKIKIYYDSQAGKDAKIPNAVMTRIKAIDSELQKKFK